MKKNSLSKKKENGIKNGQLIPLKGNLPAGVTMEKVQSMLQEDLKRTMEGVIPRLPLINILHAGALSFKMPPDETGKEARVSEFEGIIIDQHPCNAYWEQAFKDSGGGTPPTCSSLDGKRGSLPRDEEGRFGDCATCKLNKPGSGNDTEWGRACKNMKRLHILMDGYELPRRLTLPPTSIKPADNFFSGLLDRKMPYTAFKVKFSLIEGKSSTGIAYSKIQLATIDQISIEKYLEIKAFLENHLASIRGQEILTEEYISEENKESERMVNEVLEPEEDDSLPF